MKVAEKFMLGKKAFIIRSKFARLLPPADPLEIRSSLAAYLASFFIHDFAKENK